MDNVTKFLKTSYGYGYGYGYGNGYGYGDGYGYSDGYGYGNGYGYGDSYGNGYGYGYGYGNGCGNGNGNGNGYGYGNDYDYDYGNGYGNGCGNGLKSVNGVELNDIDGVPTGIYRSHGNVAKGFILQGFAVKPCYIVRDGDVFAHGKTLKDAEEALRSKVMESMDEDEAISKFVEHFKPKTLYKNSEFFEWHHYLTGSCRMGRENFCENNGVDLNGESTPEYFIALTEHSFGGGTIAKLKRYYTEVK